MHVDDGAVAVGAVRRITTTLQRLSWCNWLWERGSRACKTPRCLDGSSTVPYPTLRANKEPFVTAMQSNIGSDSISPGNLEPISSACLQRHGIGKLNVLYICPEITGAYPQEFCRVLYIVRYYHFCCCGLTEEGFEVICNYVDGQLLYIVHDI